MKKYYMHTLNGAPAFYEEEEGVKQICFAGNSHSARHQNILRATSLEQIYKEQRADEKMDYDCYHAFEHGYIVIYV